MSGPPDAIRLEIHPDGVAELVLARPDAGNALGLSACRELRAKAEALAAAPAVRAVLLRAEGRAFCVGGDLAEFAASDTPDQLVREIVEALHAAVLTLRRLPAPIVVAVLTLRRLPAPIVVAVQGAAAGAGLGLAAMGDLVIASNKARFAWAYPAVGLSADGGVSWLLPRLIGLRLSQDLAFGGRTLDADEAAGCGLVTRVVDDGQLADLALREARRIAQGPTLAYAGLKRLLEDASAASLADQLQREAQEIAPLAATADGREGVRAFLEKRRPAFRGEA